jgi:hypothetical protein
VNDQTASHSILFRGAVGIDLDKIKDQKCRHDDRRVNIAASLTSRSLLNINGASDFRAGILGSKRTFRLRTESHFCSLVPFGDLDPHNLDLGDIDRGKNKM